jgi:hypothetical protein
VLDSQQIASTGAEGASVLRQLHAARRPVQEPDTEVVFQLPDGRRGPSFLDAQAIGRAGEALHIRDRYEDEDGFEVLHCRPPAIVLPRKNSAFNPSEFITSMRNSK